MFSEMGEVSSKGNQIGLIRNYFLVSSGRRCLAELWKDVSAWRAASAWILLHSVPAPPCLDPAPWCLQTDPAEGSLCAVQCCSAPGWAACCHHCLQCRRPSWGMQGCTVCSVGARCEGGLPEGCSWLGLHRCRTIRLSGLRRSPDGDRHSDGSLGRISQSEPDLPINLTGPLY